MNFHYKDLEITQLKLFQELYSETAKLIYYLSKETAKT